MEETSAEEEDTSEAEEEGDSEDARYQINYEEVEQHTAETSEEEEETLRGLHESTKYRVKGREGVSEE